MKIAMHRSGGFKTLLIASIALSLHLGMMRNLQVTYASTNHQKVVADKALGPGLSLNMSFAINTSARELIDDIVSDSLDYSDWEREIEELSLASIKSELPSKVRLPEELESSSVSPSDTKARDQGSTTNKTYRFVKAVKGLNLRSEPWGEVKGVLKPGLKVELLSHQKPWAHVKAEGLSGYVHSSFLSVKRLVGPSKMKNAWARRKKAPGLEIKGIPVYSQNHSDPHDPDGGRGKYPQGYCGPTSLQMILDYFGIEVSRDYLALTDLGEGKMYRKGVGSRYAPMLEMARHLGFGKAEMVFSKSIAEIKKRLKDGRPVIVSMKGNLRYVTGGRNRRTSGHIVVVSGVDPNGNIVLLDPAGRGSRALMKSKDFLRVWRGFMVDLGPVQGDRMVLRSGNRQSPQES